jgi:hypothetical protein
MTEIPADATLRSPALERRRFVCPHCGAFAQQTWCVLRRLREEGYEHQGTAYLETHVRVRADGVREPNPVSAWHAAQCGSCDRWSIWHRDAMVHPAGRPLGPPAHLDMPEEVRALYEEAAAVAALSRRAGAALARAAVERLIKLLDPDAPAGANLDRRIDRIRERVSTPLGELLEVVRYVGNKMLHVEDQPGELVVLALDDQDGPALGELLLEAINDLVDELITKPTTVASLRDRLPETVRARLTGAASGASAPQGEISE